MNIEACCLPHPNDPGAYLLFLELAADEEVVQSRKPVHLALAIDSSSSMGGGRMACAVAAARAVVERLGAEDTLCLLGFDREPRVLFGPGKVTEESRREIHNALTHLKPGVGTALHAALDRSYEALRRVFVRETRPHAILLTDGFPSVGPVDPQVFYSLSQRALQEGIATSAVGVGLDFDEKCVSAIAGGGGARYSFVDKDADIPGALARHLSDLFAITVENVTVRISPASAVREATLLHRYAMKVGPDGFTVETGPIGRGAPRRLLFLLKAASRPEPVAATVALAVKGSQGDPDRILPVPVNRSAPGGREALREMHRLLLASREDAFWDAMHKGDRAAGQSALDAANTCLSALEASGASPAEVEGDRVRLLDEKSILEGRLSGAAREAVRKRSHHSTISRVTGCFDDE